MTTLHLEVDMPDSELPGFIRALHRWHYTREDISAVETRIWAKDSTLPPDQLNVILLLGEPRV